MAELYKRNGNPFFKCKPIYKRHIGRSLQAEWRRYKMKSIANFIDSMFFAVVSGICIANGWIFIAILALVLAAYGTLDKLRN